VCESVTRQSSSRKNVPNADRSSINFSLLYPAYFPPFGRVIVMDGGGRGGNVTDISSVIDSDKKIFFFYFWKETSFDSRFPVHIYEICCVHMRYLIDMSQRYIKYIYMCVCVCIVIMCSSEDEADYNTHDLNVGLIE
jgi:hypothetical protein